MGIISQFYYNQFTKKCKFYKDMGKMSSYERDHKGQIKDIHIQSNASVGSESLPSV